MGHYLIDVLKIYIKQLLEACVSNCGKNFQLEMAKQGFHTQAKEIITSVK